MESSSHRRRDIAYGESRKTRKSNMISVVVKIHTAFKRSLPQGITGDFLHVSLENNTTVGQLLKTEFEFPIEAPKLILVNGLHVKHQQLLKDGDRISIFTPMAGG